MRKLFRNIFTVISMFLFTVISFGQEEYLSEKLKPIKENYKRLNGIVNWCDRKEIKLNESTEGGTATYYFENDKLKKIVVAEYGEVYRKYSFYFTLNDKLSFVSETYLKYNRPIYWDEKLRDEMNDNEVFDIDKSVKEITLSYLEKEKIIEQKNNQENDSSFSTEYLQDETERFMTNFNNLKKKLNN